MSGLTFKAVVIVKMGNPRHFYLMTDEKGVVTAFASTVDGIRFFEDMYFRSHFRGYGSSMSACIHSICFQASAIPATGLDDLRPLIDLSDDGMVQLCVVSNIAGRMHGILLKDEEGRKAWESGDKPRLVPT